MRALPEPYYRRLLVLGSGATVLVPSKRDWLPLLRRGWVEDARWHVPPDRSLPPLRITATGLRALADWAQRGGLARIWEENARDPKETTG
jgi:hypothetical protein